MRVDVSEVIDESPIGGFHWVVVLLGAFITVIDGFDLVAMGMVVPTLSQEWGLEPSAFSTALSAALFGVLFGSAAAGTLGDMIGRRWTLIIMTVICAVFMCLSAIVTSMTELIVYRFFTGVGAGGSIPVAIALTSEYMPARHRNTLVTLMYAGAALGSVMGGFVGPTLIESYGWEGIFILGGLLPAIAAVLLLMLLPESLRFIVTKRSNNSQARQLIQRINPKFETTDDQEYYVAEVTHEGAAIRELFGGKQTVITLVIWFVFFANQFLIFFVGLWLPTVFTEAGLALASALFLLAIYNLGGACGGPTFGFLSDRSNAQRVLKITYPAAAVGVASLGYAIASESLLPIVAFLAGAAAIGSSLCLGSLTASLYPTRARSTGVGWALSVGRAGSILAPLIGGLVIGLGTKSFFLIAAIAPVLAAIGIFVLSSLTQGETSDSDDASSVIAH